MGPGLFYDYRQCNISFFWMARGHLFNVVVMNWWFLLDRTMCFYEWRIWSPWWICFVNGPIKGRGPKSRWWNEEVSMGPKNSPKISPSPPCIAFDFDEILVTGIYVCSALIGIERYFAWMSGFWLVLLWHLWTEKLMVYWKRHLVAAFLRGPLGVWRAVSHPL